MSTSPNIFASGRGSLKNMRTGKEHLGQSKLRTFVAADSKPSNRIWVENLAVATVQAEGRFSEDGFGFEL